MAFFFVTSTVSLPLHLVNNLFGVSKRENNLYIRFCSVKYLKMV